MKFSEIFMGVLTFINTGAIIYFGYVQFFKNVEEFTLTISHPFMYDFPKSVNHENLVELVFINNGTGSYSVAVGNILYSNNREFRPLIQSGRRIKEISNFEFLINPKSRISKKIRVSTQPPSGSGGIEKYTGIQFYFIDSKGKKHERVYPLFESMEARGYAYLEAKFDLLNSSRRYWFSELSGQYGEGYYLNPEALEKK